MKAVLADARTSTRFDSDCASCQFYTKTACSTVMGMANMDTEVLQVQAERYIFYCQT